MFAQINCPGVIAPRLGQSDEFMRMNDAIGLVRPREIGGFMRMNSSLLGRGTVDGKVTLSEQKLGNLSDRQRCLERRCRKRCLGAKICPVQRRKAVVEG